MLPVSTAYMMDQAGRQVEKNFGKEEKIPPRTVFFDKKNCFHAVCALRFFTATLSFAR